jgi:hypothetical protein
VNFFGGLAENHLICSVFLTSFLLASWKISKADKRLTGKITTDPNIRIFLWYVAKKRTTVQK